LPEPELISDGLLVWDYEFQIKATAPGGATAWKAVTLRVIVCRFEQLSLVDDATLDISMEIDPINAQN